MAARPWLKRLAHLWVVQNFILIGGVLQRLRFYAADYHLTEKRVYVGCFLLLVAAGFVLLAWFVQRRRSFNWLLGGNALATLALFFALQFFDVAGWVARFNVARWEQGKTLDVEYVASLGPTAWPALIHVAQTSRKDTGQEADAQLRNLAQEYRRDDWRALQWGEQPGRQQLREYLAQHPAPVK